MIQYQLWYQPVISITEINVGCRCRLLLDEGLLGGGRDLEEGGGAADTQNDTPTGSNNPQSIPETAAGASQPGNISAEARSARQQEQA